MKWTRIAFVALLALVGIAGCKEYTSAPGAYTPSVSDPNSFLVYPNPQAGLAPGRYEILGQCDAGCPSTVTITVTYDNGASATYTRSTSGTFASMASIELSTPSGLDISATAPVSSTLRLVSADNPTVIYGYSNTTTTPKIRFRSPLDKGTTYAQAYYTAIDNGGARATLNGFKTTNGFVDQSTTGCVTTATAIQCHVIFHDTKDLGYGRRMTARWNFGGDNTQYTTDDTFAFFVENYQVGASPGLGYDIANLGAAIAQNSTYHIGTNAIEFSAAPATGGKRIVKFYTYSPTTGARLNAVNLDGRGAKAMPTPCTSCHGARGDPLDYKLSSAGNTAQAGTFPRGGDLYAKLQPLEVDSFGYSNYPGYKRTDLESPLKTINHMVLCSYPVPGAADTDQPCREVRADYPNFDAVVAMIKDWYGGGTLPNATFSDTHIPSAWNGNATDRQVYNEVIAPYCRACHIARGNENNTAQGFTSPTEFAKYSTRIKSYVYDRGKMPLALLPYNNFWKSNAPTILANYLEGLAAPNTVTVRESGQVPRPGRPIADPGPSRTIKAGPVTLSAAASQYASTYSWSVTSQPGGSSYTLSNPNTSFPAFTPSGNGAYVLQLIVGNGTTQSIPANMTITVDSGLSTDPRSIRFSNIKTVMQSAPANCASSCHNSTSYPRLPVWWGSSTDTDIDRNADTLVNSVDDYIFYLEAKTRINFDDPLNSRLLRRPSGHDGHGGSIVGGFDGYDEYADDTNPGFEYTLRDKYDLFLNWILNGAPY